MALKKRFVRLTGEKVSCDGNWTDLVSVIVIDSINSWHGWLYASQIWIMWWITCLLFLLYLDLNVWFCLSDGYGCLDNVIYLQTSPCILYKSNSNVYSYVEGSIFNAYVVFYTKGLHWSQGKISWLKLPSSFISLLLLHSWYGSKVPWLLRRNESTVPNHIGLENHHFSFSVSLSTRCNYRRVKL